METNDFAAFVAYFRQLAQQHTALAGSFVHGPARRIVEGNRSKLKYPLLWLETPALVLDDKDGTDPTGRREAALLVLMSVPAKGATDEQEDAVWAEAEAILLQVIARIRRDKKKNRLFSGFRLLSPLEPVNTLTVANEYGWRVEFQLDKTLGLCYDASQWQEGGVGA